MISEGFTAIVTLLWFICLAKSRARLPSLFSDFTAQRDTNPDGYTANVNTWKDVLCRAAHAGLISGSDGAVRRLSLETGPQLLQKLESKEWGRPLALDAVFVGTNIRVSRIIAVCILM